MDTDLYDEFGNYIGPELDENNSEASHSESEQEEEHDEESEASEENMNNPMEANNEDNNNVENYETAIILPEEKQYYPDAEEVYGDAEVLVQEEDAQDISVPLVEPLNTKTFSVLEKEIPETTYSANYYSSFVNSPDRVRNIAVLGSLQHGKTSFLDMLIESTHAKKWPLDSEIRYTDTLKAEQDRHISIQSTPVSLLLQNSNGHPYLLNFIDVPGHTNFSGEITASLRLADGCMICVDVIEGIMLQTERCIRHAVNNKVPIIVVFTKMDRLITELRLPPHDAYLKIKAMLEHINAILLSESHDNTYTKINPIEDNVIFSSALHRWCFTLQSYAIKYCDTLKKITPEAFARRLWGSIYYQRDTKRFTKDHNETSSPSFVEFCLQPIYKLYSQVLGESPEVLKQVLLQLRIHLTKAEYSFSSGCLLRRVLSSYFVDHSCIVDSAIHIIPSPVEGNKLKVEQYYTGDLTSPVAQRMIECSAEGPLVINITKMFPNPAGDSFYAFGRIMSGTVQPDDAVDVLGESYIPDDTEDIVHTTIKSISIPEARYNVAITKAVAGNLVLLEGLSDAIIKTATVVNRDIEDINIFKPLEFNTQSVVRLAIEPLHPSELQKMIEGLRSVCKAYPLISTRVEANGAYILLGTGELQLDCAMHDLRELYSHIEIKVADPVSSFCETIQRSSSLQCFAETHNHMNKLTMIAEPLEKGLADDIENGVVKFDWSSSQRSKFFETKYNWDRLASRGIWAFGPETQGANVLLDGTLPEEVDRELLYDIRSSVVQGFRWGCREGPLCEEPIRNVKFSLTGASISDQPIYRGAGQIIPTARRVAYSSFLLAEPRLYEPIYEVEIQISPDIKDACETLLLRRRGFVKSIKNKPATPFFTLQAFIPVMDSFGFETDLRVSTAGVAFPQFVFSHWSIVPGDPLDQDAVIIPNEASTGDRLARDYMIKTRRRKGLSEDVSKNKFFDDLMLREINNQRIEEQML